MEKVLQSVAKRCINRIGGLENAVFRGATT